MEESGHVTFHFWNRDVQQATEAEDKSQERVDPDETLDESKAAPLPVPESTGQEVPQTTPAV